MDAPIISSEGLLRLVELVDRLKDRDLDEGDASWTATVGACSPDGGGRPEATRWEVLPELNRRAAVQLLSLLMSRVLTSPSAAGGGGDGGAPRA